MSKFRCCAKVYHPGMWHSYPCAREGPRERDGKHYCWQHDPKIITAKAKEKEDQRRAENLRAEVIRADGKALIKRLGCGDVVLSRDTYFPVRRLSITFTEATRLAERLL